MKFRCLYKENYNTLFFTCGGAIRYISYKLSCKVQIACIGSGNIYLSTDFLNARGQAIRMQALRALFSTMPALQDKHSLKRATRIFLLQTNLISMESLLKVIDPNQLTPDMDGGLHYDHSTWIELRCVSTFDIFIRGFILHYESYIVRFGHLCGTELVRISIFQALEDFLWQSCDMLDRMEDMREDLNHNDFADDASGAKKAIEAHNEAKRKILKVPVENIDNVGQRLLQRYA